MSEEKRNPNAEISEAKLEGVSGGIGNDEFEQRAYIMCRNCILDGDHCSGHIYYSLGAYLREHGIDSVAPINYKKKCPYYIP